VRTAFFATLSELAERDPRITLVTGDLGFGVLETFAGRFPSQFLNAGVAEQNMTGVAAGMALSGRVVFTYSIANFPTLRCLEQIRNDVCYHGASVKVVSVGGGYAYGSLGVTHHATEDLAILRTLPDMTVVAPGDPREVALATRQLAARPGPAYLRLGRAGEPNVHAEGVAFELGRAIQMGDGRDLTVMSTGGMLALTTTAVQALRAEGVSVRQLSMHTLKPIDEDAIRAAARETGGIVTVEEHSVVGGLAGAVAEVMARLGTGTRLRPVALGDSFCKTVGDQDYLLARAGLTSEGIAAAGRELLRAS
jgi:transketolase